MQHILYDKFSYDKFYFTGVNVSTSLLWRVYFDNPLANRIKCSEYFDKFSLLTRTDEQNLYFQTRFSTTSALVQKLAC